MVVLDNFTDTIVSGRTLNALVCIIQPSVGTQEYKTLNTKAKYKIKAQRVKIESGYYV